MQLALLADVVKHHHGADHDAVAVLDRCGRVLHRDRGAVAAREHDVVAQGHDAAFGEAAQDRVVDLLARRLVREPNDLFDRPALRVAPLPARELLGNGVQVLDVTRVVRRDDRVADRLQRHLCAFFLVEQRALGRFALRDVGDRSFVVERPALGVEHDARIFHRDDRTSVAPAQLILEVADATVGRQLGDQAFALLRLDEQLCHVQP